MNSHLSLSHLVAEIYSVISSQGLVICQGDSGYTVIGNANDPKVVKRIKSVRSLSANQHLTLLLDDYKKIGEFGTLTTPQFRSLRTMPAGEFTFILNARSNLLKGLINQKRRQVGIRINASPVIKALLEYDASMIISSASIPPPLYNSETLNGDDSDFYVDSEYIHQQFFNQVKLFIDSGSVAYDPTTVIDFTVAPFKIVRAGKGDVNLLN